MKKKSLDSLSFNKKKISNLSLNRTRGGGGGDGKTTAKIINTIVITMHKI